MSRLACEQCSALRQWYWSGLLNWRISGEAHLQEEGHAVAHGNRALRGRRLPATAQGKKAARRAAGSSHRRLLQGDNRRGARRSRRRAPLNLLCLAVHGQRRRAARVQRGALQVGPPKYRSARQRS